MGTALRRRHAALALSLVAAVLLLSGCVTLSDPEASQDFSADAVGLVDNDHSVGQTLVARRPRLNGVELWLVVPATTPSTELVAELFPDPQAASPLASVHLAVSGKPVPQRVGLDFAPLDSPSGQSYYLRLSTRGPEALIQGRNSDVYPGGQAFVDGLPVEADVAFRLTYDYGPQAMIGDLAGLLPRAWLALPLFVLLFLPGWLLLDLLGLRAHFDGGEQAALACGLSLALVPLLLLWTSTAGLPWSRPAVLAGAVLLAAVAGWRLLRRRPWLRRSPPHTGNLESKAWAWALAGILVLTLAVRLAMIRDLAVPAWVDSVHHALITQLIVDQGALPSSYAPLVQAETANYHAGFHSVVAAFHWLSGLDVPQAMLLIGQVLNALTVLSAYLLAMDLTRDRVVGLAAALVVGLISPMPAYYASWGRYTELAGLIILPAAFAVTRRAIQIPENVSSKLTSLRRSERRLRATAADCGAIPNCQVGDCFGANDAPRHDRLHTVRAARYLALAVLLSAGLLLVHNRVAAFYGCLLLAYWLGQGWVRGTRWRHLAGDVLQFAIIGAGAAVLTLPWLGPALATLWLPKLQAWSGANPRTYLDFSWSYLVRDQGKYVLVLAGLGLGWALVRRQRFGVVLAGWMALLFLLPSPGLLGLPGAGFVNFVSVEIALFLPFSVLNGYVASQLLSGWRAALVPRRAGLYRGIVATLATGLALFGAWTQLPILNMDTVLFRQADEPAMAWIRDNVPADALLLINPMPWSTTLYAGHDGGYWIAPLAGRQTLPPPLLYGLAAKKDVSAINKFCAAVIQQSQDPEQLWSLLEQWGVTYVYIGARGGVLSAPLIASSQHFRTVYAQNGVSIFQVVDAAGA